jgi:putative NADH-flavin reductase
MTVLVVGASGATGRLLVRDLLGLGHTVKVIVRSTGRLPEHITRHERVSVIRASVLELADGELARQVRGCAAVASCLGHNLSVKGIYGHPRRLVTDATRRLCEAITSNTPARPVRFLLMNTAGNRNRNLPEPATIRERAVMRLIRLLLPPHVDNERAADHLRVQIGQEHQAVEWAVVRPDTLIDEAHVTAYDVHPSPVRSALFNAGRTSRINVADFMAALIVDDELWLRWKGRMPVIYNRSGSRPARTPA